MKEKLKKVTKYVAVLLLAICIMQTPTEASAAVTTGTEFTDDRFAEEIYANKQWIYIQADSNDYAYMLVPFVNNNEVVIDITRGATKYQFNTTAEYDLYSCDGDHLTSSSSFAKGVAIDEDVYIACGGENMLVTLSGNEIYNSIPEPEVTPEPTPSETTGGVQFSDIFDATIVDVLINILKKMTHLFTIFPLNVVMIAFICGIAFGLLGKAKRTATNK